jgi:hypothetical protein
LVTWQKKRLAATKWRLQTTTQILDNGDSGQSGSLAPQNVRPKGKGQKTVLLQSENLSFLQPPLGPQQEADGSGLIDKSGGQRSRPFHFPGHQSMSMGGKISLTDQGDRCNLHGHGAVALLTSLDHDPLPSTLGIPLTPILAVTRYQGQKGLHAKLGGFLDQEIHFLPLEQALGQGQRGFDQPLLLVTLDDVGNNLLFAHDPEHGEMHSAQPVKKFDGLAGLQAQNRGHVPGLLAAHFNPISMESMGGEIKTSHAYSLA